MANDQGGKLNRFTEWLKANGAELRGCEIKYSDSSKGFGIFSSNHAQDGILMVVPLHLAITPKTVLEDPLIGHECRLMFEDGNVDDRLLIMVYLTVHRLRENSLWKPYLDVLPNKFGNPLWFTADELLELKGTTLHRATELQKKNLKSLFDDKVKNLVEKLLAVDGECQSRDVNFEDFLWANSIFWSRALNIPLPRTFEFPQVQKTKDKETGESVKINQYESQNAQDGSSFSDDETVWIEGLVPGIDFCNHDVKPYATWEVDRIGSTTGVCSSMYLLSAAESVNPCDEKEISISYGDKGNEELLYLYGFVIENNPDDYLMVHYPIEALAKMPFSEAKMQLLEAQTAQTRCLLPRSLLKGGFFHEGGGENDGDNQLVTHSPCELSSYQDKIIFPEEFLSALRTIAIKESELYHVTSLLLEVVGPERAREPSAEEVQSAIKKTCGDTNALQLLVDLLNMRMTELEEGTGTEETDAELLSAEKERLLKDGNYRNRLSSLVYRRGQKELTRRFLKEAEQGLELAMLHQK